MPFVGTTSDDGQPDVGTDTYLFTIGKRLARYGDKESAGVVGARHTWNLLLKQHKVPEALAEASAAVRINQCQRKHTPLGDVLAYASTRGG